MRVSKHLSLVKRLPFIKFYKMLFGVYWTVYKEEQGADFGDYGVSRYQRAVKGLANYGGSDEK